MTKTCSNPECGRQFNPEGVAKSERDPEGRCWWCAHGIPVYPKRKAKKAKEGK